MALDLFEQEQSDAMAYAGRNLARELPTTGGETFRAAVTESFLFRQSTAHLNARTAAGADYAQEIEQRTGDQTLQPALATGGVEAMNRRIAALATEHPELELKPLSTDELERRAVARSQRARADVQALATREQGPGSLAGSIGGSLVGGLTDPVNVLTFPLAAPQGLGIARTALGWAGIAGGTQAAIELIGQPYRETVQPGYGASAEPARNIIEATVAGGVLGGSFRAIAMGWSRVKNVEWPRTIRDAGNVVESEAQVTATNRFPGVEGEVAHRQALSKTIDDLASGRAVDVDDIVTPEMQTAYQARFTSIDEARLRAAETGAAEDIGDVAFELQGMARAAGATLNRADADLIAARLVKMPDDEARALMDEFLLRPTTLADTLPELPALGSVAMRNGADPVSPAAVVAAPPSGSPAVAAIASELKPGQMAKTLAAPDTEAAVARNLDRLRAERPDDLQIPVGETIGADGKPVVVMRKLDDVIAEAEAREAAAQKILDCIGPYPKGGE